MAGKREGGRRKKREETASPTEWHWMQILKGKKIPVLWEVGSSHKDNRKGAQKTELQLEEVLNWWQASQKLGL